MFHKADKKTVPNDSNRPIEIFIALFSKDSYFDCKFIENYQDNTVPAIRDPVLGYLYTSMYFNSPSNNFIFHFDYKISTPMLCSNISPIKILFYRENDPQSVSYITGSFKNYYRPKKSRNRIENVWDTKDLFIFVNCQLSKAINNNRINLVEQEINNLQQFFTDMNCVIHYFSGPIKDVNFTDTIITDIIEFIEHNMVTICKECRISNEKNSLFCSNCGKLLN